MFDIMIEPFAPPRLKPENRWLPPGARDLLDLVARPTPHARTRRLAAYRARMQAKNCPAKWPKSRVVWE